MEMNQREIEKKKSALEQPSYILYVLPITCSSSRRDHQDTSPTDFGRLFRNFFSRGSALLAFLFISFMPLNCLLCFKKINNIQVSFAKTGVIALS